MRFPANISHMCSVELALKGLASAGKVPLCTGFSRIPDAQILPLVAFASSFGASVASTCFLGFAGCISCSLIGCLDCHEFA